MVVKKAIEASVDAVIDVVHVGVRSIHILHLALGMDQGGQSVGRGHVETTRLGNHTNAAFLGEILIQGVVHNIGYLMIST
jgi:hypothetical protein